MRLFPATFLAVSNEVAIHIESQELTECIFTLLMLKREHVIAGLTRNLIFIQKDSGFRRNDVLRSKFAQVHIIEDESSFKKKSRF